MAFINVIIKSDHELLKRIECKLDKLLAGGNVEKAVEDLKKGRTELKKAIDKNTPDKGITKP